MKPDIVSKIVSYTDELKNENSNIISTNLSICLNSGYVGVRSLVPTEDKNLLEVDTRLYFDEKYFNISELTYKEFSRAVDLLLKQETIRRINVLHNIK